jgi:hypothetical protein
MRRGIDILSSVVEHQLGHEPYTGDCFVWLSCRSADSLTGSV